MVHREFALQPVCVSFVQYTSKNLGGNIEEPKAQMHL